MADGSLIVTNAGLAAVIAANRSGTEKVTITSAGFGSGKYVPAPTRTALYAQFKTINTIAGGGIDEYTIHVEIRDTSSDAYTVYELGLYTSTGTLFAVASSVDTPIMQKAAGAVGIIVCDIRLSEVGVQSITFGDVNFTVNQATETESGVAEIATLAEAAAGTDDARIVTPKKLKAETNKLVHLTGNETVAGVKTFSASPKAPTPAASENSTVVPTTEWVKQLISATLLAAHPIGSYYMSEAATNPSQLFGGTWAQVKDRMLIGAGNLYAAGSEGGSATHRNTTAEMPPHSHTASTSSSGAHTHTATTSWVRDHVHDKGSLRITGGGKINTQPFETSGWGAIKITTVPGPRTGTRHDDYCHQINLDTNYGGFTGTTGWAGGHNHTLSTTSDGSHTHSVSISQTGSGLEYSILNPYRAVYIWRRTA